MVERGKNLRSTATQRSEGYESAVVPMALR